MPAGSPTAPPTPWGTHVKRTLVPGALGLVGLLGSSAFALAPTVTAKAAAPAQIVRADSGVTWVTCEKFGLGAGGTDCGYVTVPLDWAKPNGTKIKLAISRVKATVPAAKYQGVMLVNPGGPGGSGLEFSGLQGLMPGGTGNAYDWVGFDPRGVGDSQPSMSCIRDFASAQHPPYIPANQINYTGFSYGTYLGQVYATMYPTHVRRMILDGNVDPRGVWYSAQLSQDKAFERVATQFFAWTAKHNDTYKLGTSAGAVRSK